jgi:glucoamylase
MYRDGCKRRPTPDLARKDCVGTARNRRSKVWFTVADDVLSDIYFPTNDNTNNETLQFVVTDGRTFTDLQTRDMTNRSSSAYARLQAATRTARSTRAWCRRRWTC